MGLEVLADLGRVDIDMNDLGRRVEIAEAAHRAVVKTHPDADHDIGFVGGHVGVEVAVHAEEAVREIVVLRHARNPQQRSQHRGIRALGKLDQLGLRLRLHDAVPGDDDRLLGRVDGLGRLDHLFLARNVHDRIAAQRDALRIAVPLGLLDEHVLGNVNEHRTFTPGRGDMEGFLDRRRNLRGAHQQVVVLRDRQRDAGDICFLEPVAANQVARDVAGQHDHRHRIHVGGGDAGDEVGRAGARGRQANTGAAGDAGIAVGSVRGSLFVSYKDVLDIWVFPQRVVERQDDPAGVAEEDLDPLRTQALHQDSGAGQTHGVLLSLHPASWPGVVDSFLSVVVARLESAIPR